MLGFQLSFGGGVLSQFWPQFPLTTCLGCGVPGRVVGVDGFTSTQVRGCCSRVERFCGGCSVCADLWRLWGTQGSTGWFEGDIIMTQGWVDKYGSDWGQIWMPSRQSGSPWHAIRIWWIIMCQIRICPVDYNRCKHWEMALKLLVSGMLKIIIKIPETRSLLYLMVKSSNIHFHTTAPSKKILVATT